MELAELLVRTSTEVVDFESSEGGEKKEVVVDYRNRENDHR